MVKIECLLCEKPIKLPKYIDTENYDGEVVCQECKSLLYIRLLKSKVKKYKFKEAGFREKYGDRLPAGLVVELFQILEQKQKELREEEGKHEEK